MSPARAAADAGRSLQRLARPAGTFDAARYFRGTDGLGFYNVGTAAMRALARSIHAEHKEWSIGDAQTYEADPAPAVRERYAEATGLVLNRPSATSLIRPR